MWSEHQDPGSGKLYYHNSATGATVWEKPAELANVMDEWDEILDPGHNKSYYVNKKTQATQWEKPAGWVGLAEMLAIMEQQNLGHDEIEEMVSDEKLLSATVWDDPTNGKLPSDIGVLFAPTGMQIVSTNNSPIMLATYEEIEGWEVEDGDEEQADLVRIKIKIVGEMSLEVDDAELYSAVLNWVIPEEANSYQEDAEVAGATGSGGYGDNGSRSKSPGEGADAETMRMIEMLMSMDDDENMAKKANDGWGDAGGGGGGGGDGGGGGGGGGDMDAATLAMMQQLMNEDEGEEAAKKMAENMRNSDHEDSKPVKKPKSPPKPAETDEETLKMIKQMEEENENMKKSMKMLNGDESDESEEDEDSPGKAGGGGQSRMAIMRGGQMNNRKKVQQGRLGIEEAQEAAAAAKARRGQLLHDTATHVKLADCVEIGFLGAGSFGNVTMVRNVNNPAETFALKEVGKQKTVEHRLVNFLIREKQALDKCRHPFVVHLHNTFQDPHCCYFLMEVVEGPDLHNIIERGNKFAPNYPDPGLTQKQVWCNISFPFTRPNMSSCSLFSSQLAY